MVISLDPRFFGSPFLMWAGIAAVLGTALAATLVVVEARRIGISRSDAYAVSVRAALWGIVAARLFHVVDYAGYYSQVPLQTAYIWNGGSAAWGAILGALAGGIFHARRRGLALETLAGAAVLPGLAAMALFRFVDFLTGQRPGAETSLPWGVMYGHPASAAYSPGFAQHPVALYELVVLLGMLGVMVLARRSAHISSFPSLSGPLARLGNIRDKHVLLLALGIYAAARLVIGFAASDPVHLGLSQAQWVGLLMLLGIGLWGIRNRRRIEDQGAGANLDGGETPTSLRRTRHHRSTGVPGVHSGPPRH